MITVPGYADQDTPDVVYVEIVYNIWDDEEGRLNHVRYPLRLTRAGVAELITAADDVVLDHGAE